MLRFKQYLCRHDYKFVARHKYTMQNLWKCKKCGVYYIQHWGIGVGAKSKTPALKDWIYEEGEEDEKTDM